MQRGLWFDGQVALERPVSVDGGDDGLWLTDDFGERHSVALADIVRLNGDSDRIKLGHRSIEGWRLLIVAPLDQGLIAKLPRRTGTLAPATGRMTMAVLIAICLLATLAAGMVIFAPEAIARHMPMAWERKIGMAFDLPIDAARCEDQAAQDALNAIVDRVDPDARDNGFTVELIDLDEANAAALPGGRMVVFNGLFKDIDSPDAIAGIVAHEIAHVRRRHVAAAMVRQLGVGTVVTALGGGAVASNAGGLLSLKFSRGAEAVADADAVAMLSRAGIDPRPTGAAFDGFGKQEGDWPEWLGDHPASKGRAIAFRHSYEPARAYRPTLSAAQTRALMSACRALQ